MHVSKKRDYFIDTLRGLMLVVMTLDHTSLYTFRATFSPIGFFGAAIGFVFLSGYVFGLVYSRYLDKPKYLFEKSYKRIWVLYKYHFGILVVIIFIDLLFMMLFDKQPIPSDITAMYHSPKKILEFVFLLYQPHYFDILPFYIVFLVFSPIVLLGFSRGYTKTILGISFFIWAIFQIPYLQTRYDGGQYALDINLGVFNLFAWQFLFVIGLFLGYKKNMAEQIVKYTKGRWIAIFIIAVSIIVIRQVGQEKDWDFVYNLLHDRKHLSAIRIISFLIILYLVGGISKFLDVKKTNYLAFLGRYSIEVFAFHIFIVYLMERAGDLSTTLSKSVQILIAVGLVISLIIPAMIKYKLSLRLKGSKSGRILRQLVPVVIINPKNRVSKFRNKIKDKFY